LLKNVKQFNFLSPPDGSANLFIAEKSIVFSTKIYKRAQNCAFLMSFLYWYIMCIKPPLHAMNAGTRTETRSFSLVCFCFGCCFSCFATQSFQGGVAYRSVKLSSRGELLGRTNVISGCSNIKHVHFSLPVKQNQGFLKYIWRKYIILLKVVHTCIKIQLVGNVT
jgi:hypothetical protein